MNGFLINNFVLYLLCLALSAFSQFTPGNLVVLQAGNGTTPLTNTGNQIVLREFTTSGMNAFSVAVSTSVNPLLISGTAVSEGGLSLSPNGRYLVFAGYAAGLTFTTSLSGLSASILNRGIGIIGAAGNYSRAVTSQVFYSGNSIRSAASDGSNNYWASGGNAGANYFGINAAAATIQTSITNSRNVIAFNSDLFLSTGSGIAGIYKVGSGFPFIPGQTCSLVINTAGTSSATASPYAFFFNQNQTICYVADDRTTANNGGIQKWFYNGNAWTLVYTLGTASNYGARGVVADFSGPNPRVYATTSESTSNRLIAINDLGSGATATTLATAAVNTIFRGLAFSPYCTAPVAGTISTGGTVCANQTFTLNTSFSGSSPLNFAWSGPGGFSSSAQNPTLNTTAGGIYSVSVNNGCGSDVSVIQINVMPLPVLSVNSSTICKGGTDTLLVSGASTYSWANGGTGNILVVTPAASSIYSVSGTSQQGCPGLAIGSVVVVDTLNVVVNSSVTCPGDTSVMIASGAMSYSWSSGANSFSFTVSPLTSTVYTVVGTAPGCTLPVVATATVLINQPVPVSFLPPRLNLCVHDPPMALMADPPGGLYAGTGIIGGMFDPGLSMVGNFLITYSYIDTNNCRNSDSVMISVNACTAYQDREEASAEIIYPNPASGILNFPPDMTSGETTIEIFDHCGQKLKQLQQFEGSSTLDVAEFRAGIYFIVFKTASTMIRFKFLKN